MTIVDTPHNAGLILGNNEDRFIPYFVWQLQRGHWNYDRVVRFRFFKEGGYIRIAKIFREYRKFQGRLVTLRGKLETNPNVDLLVGSPDIWALLPLMIFVPELQKAGIQRMLWRNGGDCRGN